jgi:peptide/nickel transport system ATP-binding protein
VVVRPRAGALTGVPSLRARELRIWSELDGVRQQIVSRADLDVAPGEAVAIVGESGSGKSMTARALIGLLPGGVRASGSVLVGDDDVLALSERRLSRLRGSRLALVLQDPFTMLNPLRRCGDQIEETRRAGGVRLSRRERALDTRRRLAEVGIDDEGAADRYPFQLSGGMRQRVAIAAALARDPKILIADEPTTALDVTTQKEILALLQSLQQSRQMGLVLITHDLRVAFATCRRIYVLYAGRVVEVGDAQAVDAEPLHPYTLGLLLSEPPLDRTVSRLPSIPGSVPRGVDEGQGCVFTERCQWAEEPCRIGVPPLAEVAPGRWTACIRIEELRDELRAARATAAPIDAGRTRPTAESAMLAIDGLVKTFPARSGRGRAVQALRDVTLEVAAGEAVGLVGESGSGKTTLARCVVGLEQADGGRIVIDGADASRWTGLDARAQRRLRGTIQMVFQDPYASLNPARTVGSALREAVSVAEAPTTARVAELLGLVGLPASYTQRKPAALSGGERQRVVIARALAVKPKLLLCDEPVSALDVSVQAQLLNLLNELREELGLSYLFITHDLAVVRQVADRLYVIHRGAIVESGSVEAVLDRPQHAYTQELVRAVPG